MQIDGTAAAEQLFGTQEPDTIHGMGGNDTITGLEGNDRLFGGDGNDDLSGQGGDDYLDGGAGNDRLVDGLGEDTLLGGAGDDYLETTGSTSLLDGGEGNDALTSYWGPATLIGGIGNDVISVHGSDHLRSAFTIDGGAGADQLYISAQGGGLNANVRGGAGVDTFTVSALPGADNAITITDFSLTEGETLAIHGWGMEATLGNPFGRAGYLRAVQSGANVQILYDADGAAGSAHTFRPLLTLTNVNLADLGAQHISGGYDPHGSMTGANLTGTELGDGITGGNNDDTIKGLGGDDVLVGGTGNDSMDGGAGWDYLSGEFGDDTLFGADGDDTLVGGDGHDKLYGGAGNDSLQGGLGNDTLDGGDGNDTLTDTGGASVLLGGLGNDRLLSGLGSKSRLEGGDGNDTLTSGNSADTIFGGAGDDTIDLSTGSGSYTLFADGGTGNDRFSLFGTGKTAIRATGGEGQDTYYFLQFGGGLVITDFAAGAGGDILDVFGLNFGASGTNPFGAPGYLRIVQQGADTLLQYDADGAAGTAQQFKTIATLAGVTATKLVPSNFTQGAYPAGYQPANVWYGTDSAEAISVTDAPYYIRGLGGNDTLTGGSGNDTIDGGAGSDKLIGGLGHDIARFDGAIAAYTITHAGSGADTVSTVAALAGGDTDTLQGIERLVFSDLAIALDMAGVGGQVYRLYQAAFNRTPDLVGVGFWIEMGDRGISLETMANSFMTSPEFKSLYGGAPTNEALVRLFYVNALHRQPDEAGVAFWTAALDEGRTTAASVLAGFSESAENIGAVAAVIGSGFEYDPYF